MIDLKDDMITFGRKNDCNVVLNTDSDTCVATAYSGVHFKIKRVKFRILIRQVFVKIN